MYPYHALSYLFSSALAASRAVRAAPPLPEYRLSIPGQAPCRNQRYALLPLVNWFQRFDLHQCTSALLAIPFVLHPARQEYSDRMRRLIITMRCFAKAGILGAAMLVAPMLAHAQGTDIGKEIYSIKCAVCHALD
jgi:hypothetical protein